MNVVVLKGQEQGMGAPQRKDPYTMEVDRRRNCYTYRGFGHMARYCRNWGQKGRVVDGRRLEYRERNIDVIERECGQTWTRVRIRTDIGQ